MKQTIFTKTLLKTAIAMLLSITIVLAAGCSRKQGELPLQQASPHVPAPTQPPVAENESVAAGGQGGETIAPYSTAAPFTKEDVVAISAQFQTVAEYVEALSPCEYILNRKRAQDGTPTGVTEIALRSMGPSGDPNDIRGIVVISIITESELAEDALELPEEFLGLEATLLEADWGEQLNFPVIRGIEIGAPGQAVIDAFFSYSAALPEYGPQDINPAYDETWRITYPHAFIGAMGETDLGENHTSLFTYGWCNLDAPEEWREYYTLDYGIKDGKVFSIILSHRTDSDVQLD